MAKTKRLKKQTAGRLVRAVCYTQVLSTDTPRARAEKAKCSTAARRKLNYRFAYQKLQMQLAANFTRRDLYVTLTYDDEHLPPNRKAAKSRWPHFSTGCAGSTGGPGASCAMCTSRRSSSATAADDCTTI